MSRPKKTVTVLESELGAVEGEDLTESPQEAPAAPQTAEQSPAVVFPHPLEFAPVNSKIVVTTDGAFLGGPDPTVELSKTDPANRLPVGAKIVKIVTDEGVGYLSTQLSPTIPSEPRLYKSALEAIRSFTEDHHPRGLHG
jgi:hypothetical protein